MPKTPLPLRAEDLTIFVRTLSEQLGDVSPSHLTLMNMAARAAGYQNVQHCVACRKQTGHFGASVDVPRSRLHVQGEEAICWYQSSEKVRRGFCGTCGSTLFWDPIQHDWTAVAMGVFDGPTKTSLSMHIFVSEKGDYYEIKDELPQNAQ